MSRRDSSTDRCCSALSAGIAAPRSPGTPFADDVSLAEQHLIAERDRLNKDLEQTHRCAELHFFPPAHNLTRLCVVARSQIKALELELDQIGGGPMGYGSAASRSTMGRR